MEFYAAIKKNKNCHLQVNGWNWRASFAVSQVQKDKDCMFSLIYGR
jgi:hypothetical protein